MLKSSFIIGMVLSLGFHAGSAVAGSHELEIRNKSGKQVEVDWVKYRVMSNCNYNPHGDWEVLNFGVDVTVKRDSMKTWAVSNVATDGMICVDWKVKFKCVNDGISGWETIKIEDGYSPCNDGSSTTRHKMRVNSCDQGVNNAVVENRCYDDVVWE